MGKDLMPHANAKCGVAVDELPDCFMCVWHGGWVPGAIGQEEAVRFCGIDFFLLNIGREDGDIETVV